MNPFEKGEKGRGGFEGINFHKAPDSESIKYANTPSKKGYIFIFAQPRSGSTLLTRLLSIGSFTNGLSEYTLDFYKAIDVLYRDFNVNSQYGKMRNMENNNIFPDRLKFESEEAHARLIQWHIRGMLGLDKGYHKTTIIGFSNSFVDQFAETIREVSDGKIVWLTRNTNDIVKSFQTRDGPGKSIANEDPELLRGLIEDQARQFKESSKLGDVVLKYEDLIEDPKKHILKMKPNHYPSDRLISEVMSKKLR